MKKYSRILVLAMFVLGLMSASAFAGTFTPSSTGGAIVPVTVALEAMGAARTYNMPGGNNAAMSFKSSRALISGDLLTFTFTNAGATTDNIYLCEEAVNASMDVVAPSANALTFSLRANRPVTAGANLFLSTSAITGATSCSTTGVGAYNVRFQPVTSAAMASVSFVMTTGSSTMDSANAVNFANISRQYSAGFNSANTSIDYLAAPANGSKFASNNAVTLLGSYANITAGARVYDTVTAAGLTVSGILSLQDSASWQGVKSVFLRDGVSVSCNSAGTNVVANNSPSGTVNLSIPTASFNAAANNVTNTVSICAEITGTAALQARTITASTDVNVTGTGNNDQAASSFTTVMNWLPNGYQGIVPYISASSTYGTICLINNSSASSVPITVEILSSESGATLTSLAALSGGTVAAKGTSRLDFDSNITPYTWTSGVETPGTPVALTGLNASDRYSAKINVGAALQDITVNCIQKDPAGSKRAVPVLTQITVGNYFQQ